VCTERRQAGHRRNEHLRFEPRGDDFRGDRRIGRQHAAVDEENVAVELRALVAGANVLHDAGDADDSATGNVGVDDDRVVELQIGIGFDAHPERERRGILGAEDHPDPLAGRIHGVHPP
jgi:hypothetical protein